MDTVNLNAHNLAPEFSSQQLIGRWNRLGGTQRSSLAAFVVLFVFLRYIWNSQKKQQKLVPGIPVVGGNDRASIMKNRQRFVHDSKAMLEEGYQKVKLFSPTLLKLLTNRKVV